MGCARGWLAPWTLVLLFAAGGCERAWYTGFLDPSQVGRFSQANKRREIRRTLGVLIDEPEGIVGATEPTNEDLLVEYAETPIGPSDVLEISIFELLQVNNEFRANRIVNEVGYISLPILGLMKVAGKTPRQYELELIDTLQKNGTLADAQVSVTVVQSQGKRYTVIGSTSRPGIFSIPRPNFRLLDAIGDAGGVPPGIKTIYIIRTAQTEPKVSSVSEQLFQNQQRLPESGSAPATGAPANPAAAEEQSKNASSRVFDLLERPTLVEPPPSPAPQSHPAGSSPATNSAGTQSSPSLSGVAFQETPGTGSSSRRSTPPGKNDDDDLVIEQVLPIPANATQPQLKDLDQAVQPPADGAPWVYDSAAKGFRPISPATTSAPQESSAPADPTGAATSSTSQKKELDWGELIEPETVTRVIAIPAEPLQNGDQRYNVAIRSNDVINIAPGPIGEFYVMGNVLRPGAYALNGRDIGIREAIAAAGGFGQLAMPSVAELVRRGAGDEEEIIPINLDAIFAGEADNIFLRPSDVINVGTSPLMPFIATIRNAFRVSYGFGFVYDRNFADIDSFQGQSNPDERARALRQLRGFPQ